MKKQLIILIGLLAFSFMSMTTVPASPLLKLLTKSAQSSVLKTVVLEVPGMTCPICPITVRKALEKIQSVHKATVRFNTKTVTVVFDSNITSIETLIQATKNAGYDSSLQKLTSLDS